ncbi:MAG: S24/S26 family peptidase [Ardenticatenaceae bacterium]|nr:S24/S26 family peptidase [Ardenticatenaceae bacterium]
MDRQLPDTSHAHCLCPAARPAHLISEWLPFLREILAREEPFRWRLHGTSMVPTLPPGCEIDIVPLPAVVRLGDVVVFAAGDTLVAHRLVHRSRGHWITQGDARRTPDRPLDPALVVGAVRAAYRRERRCWPRRLSRPWSLIWVVRYHVLRAVRAIQGVRKRLRL